MEVAFPSFLGRSFRVPRGVDPVNDTSSMFTHSGQAALWQVAPDLHLTRISLHVPRTSLATWTPLLREIRIYTLLSRQQTQPRKIIYVLGVLT